MSLLIANNHTQAHLYGLTFFKTALKQIQDSKIEAMQNISIALRIARFADDEEFKKFISDADDEMIVADDEFISF